MNDTDHTIWHLMPFWGNFLATYVGVALLGMLLFVLFFGVLRPKLWPLFTYGWPLGVVILVAKMLWWLFEAVKAAVFE